MESDGKPPTRPPVTLPTSYSLPYAGISTSPFPHTPFPPSQNFCLLAHPLPFCHRPTTSYHNPSSLPRLPFPPSHISHRPPLHTFLAQGVGACLCRSREEGVSKNAHSDPSGPGRDRQPRPVPLNGPGLWAGGRTQGRGEAPGWAGPPPNPPAVSRAGSLPACSGLCSSDHALGRALRPPGRAAAAAATDPPTHAVSVPKPRRPAPPGGTKGASPLPGPGCSWGSWSQRKARPQHLPSSPPPLGGGSPGPSHKGLPALIPGRGRAGRHPLSAKQGVGRLRKVWAGGLGRGRLTPTAQARSAGPVPERDRWDVRWGSR